jgi:hypothetical protein
MPRLYMGLAKPYEAVFALSGFPEGEGGFYGFYPGVARNPEGSSAVEAGISAGAGEIVLLFCQRIFHLLFQAADRSGCIFVTINKVEP